MASSETVCVPVDCDLTETHFSLGVPANSETFFSVSSSEVTLASESASAPVLLSVSDELLESLESVVAISALIASTRFLTFLALSFSTFSLSAFCPESKRCC